MGQSKLDNWALLTAIRSVTHFPVGATAKLVAYTLASHRSAMTGQCNPKSKTLCTETSLSRRGVQNALHELLEERVIKRVEGTGVGVKESHYIFTYDAKDLDDLELAMYTQGETGWGMAPIREIKRRRKAPIELVASLGKRTKL